MPKGRGFYRCDLMLCNPRAIHCNLQNVDCGVCISVQRSGTIQTEVPTLRKFLLGSVPAGMTVLTGVAWVYGNHFTTGTFSLIRENGAELEPRSVTDWLSKTMIGEHTFNIQLFNGNHAKAINKTAGGLMHKIMAAATNTLMDTGQDLVGFSARLRAFLGFGLLPASLCQRLFITAKKRGFSMNSPLDKAKNEFRPASSPIVSALGGRRSSSCSTEKQTNHLLPYRRTVHVFTMPVIARCSLALICSCLFNNESVMVLLPILKPLCG